MKDLLIIILIVAIAVLWLDDRAKRSALDADQTLIDSQANMAQQIQALTTERDQLKGQVDQATGPRGTSWFQQRLNDPSSLDRPPK